MIKSFHFWFDLSSHVVPESKMQYNLSLSATPYFDRAHSTRILCIIGLTFSWLFALSSIGVGAAASRNIWQFTFSKSYYTNLVVLAQNVLITICNESLGLIHSLSLRWALQSEGRLSFNSNLRLLSSSRKFGPNKWYSNVLVLSGIITTYGSSSLTFLLFNNGDYSAYQVSGAAFVALGCGMAAQASIATWALLLSGDFPTWSSDVMDTAAACLAISPGLERRPGRGLQGVHSTASSGSPVYPQQWQSSAYTASKEIRQVMWLLWLVVVLGLIWTVTFAVIGRRTLSSRCAWSLLSIDCLTGPILPWQDALNTGNLPAAVFTWVFFLICALQATFTIALHCAELLVNCSRDETKWRKMSSRKGSKRTSNALFVLLSSWQSLMLFCLKPFIQWLFSLIFFIDISNGLTFGAAQVLYLTAGLIFVSIFSSVIMFWRYKGPQPATFGHLQSLVDMMDEWPEAKDRAYWGDKGETAGVAKAGTSWMPLAPIRFDKLYA